VRRATLEDLPVLQAVWDVSRLPGLELERHLTEFQLALRPDGVVMAAIALRVAGAQGWLHSEAGYTAEPPSEYRSALWERLHILARNHGLVRLWMKGEPAAFWQAAGFRPATAEELQKLPAAWPAEPALWHTLALKGEALMSDAVAGQFARFHSEQREAAERLRQQGERLKWLAVLVAVVFFLGAIRVAVLVLRAARHSRQP
jgi:N-acetylglutamate synthase-like GNAT family acetyltransferase